MAKVNEGWDVLNLYDIVRISEQASSSKPARTVRRSLSDAAHVTSRSCMTASRASPAGLITAKDLSVLEQLHYHTINEPAYIKTLHALRAGGH